MKRVSSSSSNKEKSHSSSLRCPIFRSQISPVPSSNPLSPVRQMQIHHPNCPTVPTQGFLFLIKGWRRVLDGHGVAGGSGSHENGGGGGNQSPQSSVLEQDRFLQIANIGRIMKKALRANRKIAEDAKDTVHECVSEFISFLTSYYALQCSEYSLIC